MTQLQAINGGDARSADDGSDDRPVVVHVIDQLGIGGMEIVAVNVIERTTSRYRHRVVCLRAATGRLVSKLESLGVPVLSVGKRPGKDLAAYWRLWRLFRRMRPGLVQTYNIGAIDAAFWARLAGVPRVVHAEHGRDAADPEGRNAKYRLLRRALAPAISVFVAVSADLEDWLCTHVGIARRKVRLIYNGIDTQSYRVPASRSCVGPPQFGSSDSVFIGSVGRLNPVKAFDGLIEAFAELRGRQARDVKLVIVGEGAQRPALERRIAALGLVPHVWLAGEREDVAQMLQSLDVYVCSSIAEGVALTILEAMATGLPVVATHVGGNPELVRSDQTGALVPPSAPEALAGALERYVDQPELARQHGSEARKRVCRYFSIEAMTDNYCRLYDQLLGVASSPGFNQEGS